MKLIAKAVAIRIVLIPMTAVAAGAELHLDRAPDRTRDPAALQHGAKLFVNYCLNCHSASYMRYNRLQEIGLSEQQIKGNLMFTADKIGEPMTIAMRSGESKLWFGAAPPDLTLIARSRASEFGSGADWLYTYLRTFYRDSGRPTGWNNAVFENVGMPHALWDLQGEQIAHIDEKDDGHGGKRKEFRFEIAKPGSMNKEEYDNAVADLVSFLVYVGEPMAETRKQVGIGVLLVLAILFVLAYALKKNYWKDVH